jgi:tetratricopeptide (TPR) repeat protein
VALPTRFHPFRAIGLAALGLALAWLVVSRTFVAYLARTAPEAALWLRPGDPEALLNLAERRVDAADGPAGSRDGTERARAWAETALGADPVSARALRVLGQLAHAAGDDERAAGYLRRAARHSIQESAAVSWLLHDSYAKKDYASALHFADTLLRTRTRALPDVLPVMGRMAESASAARELHKLLAGNPPWRRAFLSGLPRAVSDARTPLKVLVALKETANPPDLADIRDYVALLVEHKFYELAYYTWLQFLPREQLAGAGFLFNGSFELSPSGLPFDWQIHAGMGATVDLAPRPDAARGHALRIELGPGRVELGGVTQMLLLAPGSYRFGGKYRGEIAGPRGLVWRIACADGTGAPLGQSPTAIGGAPRWKDVAFSFTVPDAGCRAQQLHLVLDARMPSEQLVSGTLWYDELTVARAD